MTSDKSFARLIRFEDEEGATRFGDPIINEVEGLYSSLKNDNLLAEVYSGNTPFDVTATGTSIKVKKLLPILEPSDVPIVKCIGLNYMKHIREAGRTPPPYPTIFIKPRNSIAGFDEDIPITKVAQESQLDYEGELSIIVGKTGKDIKKEDALGYIAGYVVSNDVSERKWQRDPAYAGGVPQWCFSKGFDKWAPLGPVIVSPRIIGNAGKLALRTWVDGGLRQESNTDDLIFGIEAIIEFVSQGTTLEQGTVIMTGTPSGVALGMKDTPWLKNGSVVKVEIEQLGSVENKMRYE